MNQPQYKLAWPPFTRSMIVLAVLLFGVWFGGVLASAQSVVVEWGALTANGVLEGYRVWTFLTHPFIQTDFLGIVFAVVAVWLFGGELEQSWGTRRFWMVIVGAGLLGGLFSFPFQVFLAPEAPLLGFHAPILALITAYCRRNWNRELYFFFFPMSGRTMFIFFAGLSLVLALFAHWIVLPADIAGILVGWFVDRRGGSFSWRDLKTRFRMWNARRRLKVVKSPDDDKPRYIN